jgi:hypothetical protein
METVGYKITLHQLLLGRIILFLEEMGEGALRREEVTVKHRN